MDDELTPGIIRQWKPADHAELFACWRALLPEFRLPSPPPEELTRRFGGHDLTPQQAGWVFEHWVCEAFRLVTAPTDRVKGPFTVQLDSSQRTKEEVDGLVTVGWQGFLIESKFEADPTPFDPIARLYLQVGRRPRGTIGLFFSRVYSIAAEELAAELRPIRVLLFRADEIQWALTREPPLDMLEIVRRKWRAAMELAVPDFSIALLPE
jgi:hypothetical protein